MNIDVFTHIEHNAIKHRIYQHVASGHYQNYFKELSAKEEAMNK